YIFVFSSRRRHTRFKCDWSSDVCSSDLLPAEGDELCVGFVFVARREDAHGQNMIRVEAQVTSSQVNEALKSEPRRGEKDQGNRRSEERRVGKECRYRWEAYDMTKERSCR